MEDLDRYIRNAPLCNGLDGLRCTDYVSRLDTTAPEKKYPNKYCAILIEYDTGLHYYDRYCESCRFKNEVKHVISVIKSGKPYIFNPWESVDSDSFPKRIRGVDNFNYKSSKNYCKNYNPSRQKRERPSDDNIPEFTKEKRRKIEDKITDLFAEIKKGY